MLNRTQSAVSLQIKRLEDELGTRLLDRTSRSVALTPAGRRLLPYARQLLQLQKSALDHVSAASAPEVIRFGLPEEQAIACLPHLLPLVAETWPNLQIEIVCEISSSLIEKFQRGLLDVVLAVRHGPTRTGRVIGLEPMIWAASPAFEWSSDTPLPLALNPEGCIFRAHATAAIGKAGLSWRQPYVSASPTGVNLPVQAGLAATIKTPRSLPGDCEDAGTRLGLPPLGLVEIEMHVSPASISPAFHWFTETVESIVTASRTMRAAAV
jgi:DNA-binding transcriptional LysR family regulator